MHKKATVTITALALFIISIFVRHNYLQNNVDYQMNKLERGTTEEKGEAIEFIGKNKAYDKIPAIMEYIDSYESYLYLGKDSTPLTCDVTLALEELTGLQYGNTCDSDNSKTEEEEAKTIKTWKDWYVNNYQKWLQEHQN